MAKDPDKSPPEHKPPPGTSADNTLPPAAPAMTSDDPAVLHVAAATLAQKIELLGIPTGMVTDVMVNATAKAMLDAVDMFKAGGGGTQKAES